MQPILSALGECVGGLRREKGGGREGGREGRKRRGWGLHVKPMLSALGKCAGRGEEVREGDKGMRQAGGQGRKGDRSLVDLLHHMH